MAEDRPDPVADALDVVAITQVLNRYPHAVDQRDWVAFGSIFMADARCDMEAVGLGTTHGLDELVACFDAASHPVAHHLVDPVVVVDGDTAVVTSKWLVVLADRTTLSGEYHDRLVRCPVGWRIQDRAITPRQQGSRHPVGSVPESPS